MTTRLEQRVHRRACALLVLIVLDTLTSACRVVNEYDANIELDGKKTTQHIVHVRATNDAPACNLKVGNVRVEANLRPPLGNYFYNILGTVPERVETHQYSVKVVEDVSQANRSLEAFRSQVATDSANPTGRRLLLFGLGADILRAIKPASEPIGNLATVASGDFVRKTDMIAFTEELNGKFTKIDDFKNLQQQFNNNTLSWQRAAQNITRIQDQINKGFDTQLLNLTFAIANISLVQKEITENLLLLDDDMRRRDDVITAALEDRTNQLRNAQLQFAQEVATEFEISYNVTSKLAATVNDQIQRLLFLTSDDNQEINELAAAFFQFRKREVFRKPLWSAFFDALGKIPQSEVAFVGSDMIFPHSVASNPALARIDYGDDVVNFVVSETQDLQAFGVINTVSVKFYFEANTGIAANSVKISARKLIALMSTGRCRRPVVLDDQGHAIPEDPAYINSTIICFVYGEVTTRKCAAQSSSFAWRTAESGPIPLFTGTLKPQYCGSSVTTTTDVIRNYADFQNIYASRWCNATLFGPAEFMHISKATKRIAFVPQRLDMCALALKELGVAGRFDLFTSLLGSLFNSFIPFKKNAFDVQTLREGRPPFQGIKHFDQPLQPAPTTKDAEGNIILDGAASAYEGITGIFTSVSKDTIKMVSIERNLANPTTQFVDIITQIPIDSNFVPDYPIPTVSTDVFTVNEIGYPDNGLILGDIEDDASLYDCPERLLNTDTSILTRQGTFGIFLDPFANPIYWSFEDWVAFNGPYWDPEQAALSPTHWKREKVFDDQDYPYCKQPEGIPPNHTLTFQTPGGPRKFNYTPSINPDSFLCRTLKKFRVNKIFLGEDDFGVSTYGMTLEPRVWTADAYFTSLTGILTQDLGGINCSDSELKSKGPFGFTLTLLNRGSGSIEQRVLTTQDSLNISSVCTGSEEVTVRYGVPSVINIASCTSLRVTVQKLVRVTPLGRIYETCKEYTPADIQQAIFSYPGPDPEVSSAVVIVEDSVSAALSDIGTASADLSLQFIDFAAASVDIDDALQVQIADAKERLKNLTINSLSFPENVTIAADVLRPVLVALRNKATDQFLLVQNLTTQALEASAVRAEQSATILQLLATQSNLTETNAQILLQMENITGIGDRVDFKFTKSGLQNLGHLLGLLDISSGSGWLSSIGHALGDVFSDLSFPNIFSFASVIWNLIQVIGSMLGFVAFFMYMGWCNCCGGGARSVGVAKTRRLVSSRGGGQTLYERINTKDSPSAPQAPGYIS